MQAENIDSIRFMVIAPEMIKKLSVAKLIVPDTYNEDGYPIDGGLVDQRLGVIDPGLKCKTCGGRSKTCAGHFGHLELVRPVIHPEYSKMIYLLMQSTCVNCHRALVSEERIKELTPEIKKEISSVVNDEINIIEMSDADRLQAMKKLRSVKKCPHCDALQRKIKLERPTSFYIDGNRLKPDEIRDWLSKIPDSDMKLFGIDPAATRPENFVLTMLLMPPVNVRPSVTLESGERSEDDLTHKLVDIMRINKRLEQDIDVGAPQIIIDDLWELLQYHVTVYFNNETAGVPVARHRSTRPLKTLAQRLKGKEGRIRYNLSGKRVNFSARTVISPDTSLTINQVGIPRKIAETLTIPLYVTKWNIDEIKKYMERSEYPTSINIISKDGIRKRVTDVNRQELLGVVSAGDIVERQLIDGDIVLFNRQPTLHRISIMAHTVKVLPGKSMRMTISAAVPYNADFDGDEMNIHVPQSLEAQAEARYLMRPEFLMLSARDGKPIMFLEEDQIIGIYLLTKEGADFSKQEACRLLSSVGIYELPKPNKKERYDGRDIFSMILPEGLDFEYKGREGEIVIKDNKITKGAVSESMVGIDNGALILKVFEKYGSSCAMKFIFDMATLALRVAYLSGITISVKDYYIDDAMEKERKKIVEDAENKAKELITSYMTRKLESLPGYTRKETFEIELMARLSDARAVAGKMVSKQLTVDNMAYFMASIKARGSIPNLVQTSVFLGQQAVRGRRPSRGYKGRILPYIRPGQKDATSLGFVSSGFFDGLKPLEFFIHAMGARDSAMSKSLVTAVSGYLQRRLINALQDLYVDDDMTVKAANKAIVQVEYGGDSLDPMMEKLAKMKK